MTSMGMDEKRSMFSTQTMLSQVFPSNIVIHNRVKHLKFDISFFYLGRATYADKLFKFRNGRYVDILNDEINEQRDVVNRMAGRSVACVDRKVILR